ncbi:MAG: hypothetical protein HFI08_04780 [Bacilli bacterium]|nr:hypothetical protein [Bacilli bacterium]
MEIFVGCSSAENIDNKYIQIAHEVGSLIGKNGHNLIFGSSENGLMGEVYRAVKNNGGKITAVIPKEYRGFLTEVQADKVVTTDTATDQLKYLVNTGDVTIMLPGSYGAIAELTTSIQNKKLGEHNKKIFILNTYGFYDELLELFDKIYLEKFDSCNRDNLFQVVEKPIDIFKALNNF